MSKGELAKEYFYDGCNCSQAVACAFAEEMNMPIDMIKRLTIGFGGGMGRLREVCGTVSGATFVLSALFGDNDKSTVYKMVQDIAGAFEAENGSVVCRQLLGLNDNAKRSPKAEPRTEKYYKKRPCPELVEQMANILDCYLAEKLGNI